MNTTTNQRAHSVGRFIASFLSARREDWVLPNTPRFDDVTGDIPGLLSFYRAVPVDLSEDAIVLTGKVEAEIQDFCDEIETKLFKSMSSADIADYELHSLGPVPHLVYDDAVRGPEAVNSQVEFRLRAWCYLKKREE